MSALATRCPRALALHGFRNEGPVRTKLVTMQRRVILMASVLAAACHSGTSEQRLAFTPCRLDGLGVEAHCSEYPVFENRLTRQGRTLKLRVAVIPALATSPRPDPLFILVGGPGQAATQAGAQLAEALRDVRRNRDVVLVDQRGTGGSHALSCAADKGASLQKHLAAELDLDETRACRNALDADTTQYVTPIAMDDLDEVRSALGYARINLWGGSYGTRAALVYFRQYPTHVRSLVLDGVVPQAIKLPLFVARDSQRALDLVYGDCERDADCQKAFPGAKAQLWSLLEQLGSDARPVSFQNPRTGATENIRIGRSELAGVLLNLLYVPELSSLIPLAVQHASGGDFSPLMAAASAFSDAVDVSTGMFMSIVCAEDVPRISVVEASELSRNTFLGPERLAQLQAECAEWGAAPLPEAYFEPIEGVVPSLILSGNLDPVTPPAWGQRVADQLSHSRHLVVPGAGHGVSTLGCMPRLIAEFVESLDAGALDVSCVERQQRPAFFTSLLGPSP
jgi:pimeloyl-ACP methyl ester carboxylesterase